MWTKLLEGLGGQLTQKWALAIFTPAFVFWVGGLGTWVWRFGWVSLEEWFTQQSDTTIIAFMIGSLIVVVVSAAVAQRFVLPMLRFAEGYWPRPLSPLRRVLVAQNVERIAQDRGRWRELDSRGLDKLTADELQEHARLDQRLMRVPAVDNRLMPLKLGNILRAAEERPRDKYGLNAIVCWPRLWLILSAEVKTELTAARTSIDTWTLAGFWGLLFMVWGVWAWWAPLVGLLSAFTAYRGMLAAAEVYADVIESVFDVHRRILYQALRWPLPDNPAAEWQSGKQLSSYLWRGSHQPQPTFTDPSHTAGIADPPP
jgi:hypothetical protein